jgi:hypothetical protein
MWLGEATDPRGALANHTSVIIPRLVHRLGTTSVVDGRDQVHLFLTVTGWGWQFFASPLDPQLHAAEAAPVVQLHLPHLTLGRRFGRRPGERAEHREAHPQDEVRDQGGHEDLEGEFDHRLTILRPPMGRARERANGRCGPSPEP